MYEEDPRLYDDDLVRNDVRNEIFVQLSRMDDQWC